MQALALKFLSAQERAQVEAAVKAAEKETSGEIVCMVQSSSYDYPMANVIGATTLALPLSLIGTPLLGGWLWLGTQNMWLFLGLFGVLFGLGYFLVHHVPWLKRMFISQREIDEEVEEAAVTRFFQEGLYRTQDATGVLIFISVFEHKVWVLADHGINAKVPAGQWDAIVAQITDGIRHKRPAAAICEAVQNVSRILKTHFPVKPDDANELQNLIFSGD